jgi:hypothetical protein
MQATEMHWAMARVDRRGAGVGRMTILSMVLAGVSFGCAPTLNSPLADGRDATVEIQVENRSFELATVHAIWQGNSVRLGTVGGTLTVNYTLPWDRSLLLHFRIDLLAGPNCTTSQIWADPGDIIIVEVDPRLFGTDCLD